MFSGFVGCGLLMLIPHKSASDTISQHVLQGSVLDPLNYLQIYALLVHLLQLCLKRLEEIKLMIHWNVLVVLIICNFSTELNVDLCSELILNYQKFTSNSHLNILLLVVIIFYFLNLTIHAILYRSSTYLTSSVLPL